MFINVFGMRSLEVLALLCFEAALFLNFALSQPQIILSVQVVLCLLVLHHRSPVPLMKSTIFNVAFPKSFLLLLALLISYHINTLV